jgi:hypothetical protein
MKDEGGVLGIILKNEKIEITSLNYPEESFNQLDQRSKKLIGGNERLLIMDNENQVLEFEADALKSLGLDNVQLSEIMVTS